MRFAHERFEGGEVVSVDIVARYLARFAPETRDASADRLSVYSARDGAWVWSACLAPSSYELQLSGPMSARTDLNRPKLERAIRENGGPQHPASDCDAAVAVTIARKRPLRRSH